MVHPQYWPESLDYTGKRIVVIGSGATAISMIPALTEKAAHVTMLQRSPTYMLSMPRIDPIATLSESVAAKARAFDHPAPQRVVLGLMYLFARKSPSSASVLIRQPRHTNLPAGYDVDTHFKPRYNPWDQRMCLILDYDLYKAISDGRVEVVTDHIDHIDATGIVLKSGGSSTPT